MSSDKTEKPSQKRLKEAKERGQVARSRDLASSAALVAGTIAMGWLGPRMLHTLTERLAQGLRFVGDNAKADMAADTMASLVWSDGATFALVVGPLALTAAGVAVFAQVSQHGLVFAKDALAIKFDRLSPSNGIKRLGWSQAGFELIRSTFAVTVIAVIGYQAVVALVGDAHLLAGMAPGQSAATAWDHVGKFLWRSGIAMATLGILDYGMQRYKLMSQLKMTKQEVKDESKLMEGNPEIKNRVRRVQFEMSRRRMLASVKTASVVITNPTHYAVALEYRRGEMAAPRVVAKGADAMALKIRAAAREHNVPIMENPPLARALHANAEVGDFIPPDLFGAVAEVLAYLIRIKQLVM
ncbi:MAG: flagellar biosynthesis protein FlhB [Hyphomicrobiales bacterium]